MAESEARKRTRAAKGQTAPAAEAPPLQITLFGHELVLDPLDLFYSERATWKAHLRELDARDEADFMFALAAVFLQRADPAWTWERAKAEIKWRTLVDAVAAGRPAEADHPQS